MEPLPRCPFADAKRAVELQTATCPFHAHKVPAAGAQKIQSDVPVNIVGRVFTGTKDSAALLKDIGGGDRIRE